MYESYVMALAIHASTYTRKLQDFPSNSQIIMDLKVF